ncbi:MAG: hypothetical protein H0X64_10345 [Gemmatimonadaceae bacterium]|nr:hypothetical protein [Gemmatimonadaceae bacterium]
MSAKNEAPKPQDLSALDDAYRIIGELSARDNIRSYLATRTTDELDVLVLVEDAPPGDAGNALTHFAADANLLESLDHRNLIPIRDGRWLGENRFALVTDRCAAPTLATLVARNESWSYPRVATILHEVNGLLEWARKQKVVHRTLTLDTIHVEPNTDRVLASFIAEPLSKKGGPGAEGDARTIASLAWTMITRGREVPTNPEDSIGIVRPELPRRVVEATDALLHGQRMGETDPPAVLDYIALLAMTQPLMEGDVAAAELQAVIHQEQVLDREAWAATEQEYNERIEAQDRAIQAERVEMEETLRTERATMEETLRTAREEMERTLLAEREELTDTLATERQKLADERAALERQMTAQREELEAQIASEREQMAQNVATMEQQMSTEREELARHREELERQVAEQREQLAMSMSDGERALADARAEFDAETKVQREEVEQLLADQRAEFDRTIIAERNAFEAEKEGLAVFHKAEREQIEAERRALEELYLAYEAEGHVIEVEDDRSDDDPGRFSPGLLADLAPLAVAQPVVEPLPGAGDPEESESGLSRDDAKRSKRASWGLPASVVLLTVVIAGTAIGIGRGDDDGDAEASMDRDMRRAAVATPVLAARRTAVIDSAGGTIALPDSNGRIRDSMRP